MPNTKTKTTTQNGNRVLPELDSFEGAKPTSNIPGIDTGANNAFAEMLRRAAGGKSKVNSQIPSAEGTNNPRADLSKMIESFNKGDSSAMASLANGNDRDSFQTPPELAKYFDNGVQSIRPEQKQALQAAVKEKSSPGETLFDQQKLKDERDLAQARKNLDNFTNNQSSEPTISPAAMQDLQDLQIAEAEQSQLLNQAKPIESKIPNIVKVLLQKLINGGKSIQGRFTKFRSAITQAHEAGQWNAVQTTARRKRGPGSDMMSGQDTRRKIDRSESNVVFGA